MISVFKYVFLNVVSNVNNKNMLIHTLRHHIFLIKKLFIWVNLCVLKYWRTLKNKPFEKVYYGNEDGYILDICYHHLHQSSLITYDDTQK